MDNEFPRSIKDISQKYLYEETKIWTILDDGKRLSGLLRIRDDGLGLEFKLPRDQVEALQSKRIKRTTAKGSDYSRALLLNSSVWESPMTSLFKRGEARMRLNPNFLLIHGSTKPINENVTYIRGYLPGIGEWFGRDFLEFDDDEYKFKETKTIYHEMKLGDFATITLNAKLTIDIDKRFVEGQFLAYPQSFVRIDFAKPTHITGAINIFSHVENFFNFIFSVPHSTYIFTSSNTKQGKRNIPLYIFSPYRRKEFERNEKLRSSSMLFSWEDVTNRDDVFVRWVLEYSRIEEIVDTLVLLKSTKVSEQMRFTTIINALEAVHRRYFNSKAQPDEDYKAKVENILSLITDEDDKKLVEKKLEYGNEVTLRARLKEVYELGEKHGLSKPSRSVTNKIIETRNYYIHGDESKKDKILDYTGLYEANSMLGKYLKLILLQKIGVKDDELTAIVSKSPHFQFNFRDEPPHDNRYFF